MSPIKDIIAAGVRDINVSGMKEGELRDEYRMHLSDFVLW